MLARQSGRETEAQKVNVEQLQSKLAICVNPYLPSNGNQRWKEEVVAVVVRRRTLSGTEWDREEEKWIIIRGFVLFRTILLVRACIKGEREREEGWQRRIPIVVVVRRREWRRRRCRSSSNSDERRTFASRQMTRFRLKKKKEKHRRRRDENENENERFAAIERYHCLIVSFSLSS